MARRSRDNEVPWHAIESEYRLGQKSNQQLAVEFCVSNSSIGRRATKFGWVADKSQQVEAIRQSLLIQNASGNANANATPTEFEIKVAATVSADLVMSHRYGLARLGRVRDMLMIDLENSIALDRVQNFQLSSALGELLEQDRASHSLPEKSHGSKRLKSLSDRTEILKKLTEIDERIRRGEREAFGIGKETENSSAIDDLLLAVIERDKTVSP
jgi:hypothetical protein